MTIQTIAGRRHEKLLAERVTVGRRYVDAVCHGRVLVEVEALFQRMCELDAELSRFGRLSNSDRRKIEFAEDDRWHPPGHPPASGPICSYCLSGCCGTELDMAFFDEGDPSRGEVA